MKNYDEMYQSVLSKYDEYLEKKRKRIRTFKRTAPVLACFCLTIALGVGYWDHFKNLPHIPVQPNIIEESTIEKPDTTTTSTDANTTVSSETPSEPASTTAPTTNSQTDRMTTTAGVQTQTVTTVVTDATETPTTEQVVKQTETQAPATTPSVTYTQPVTDPPVVTTEEPPTTMVIANIKEIKFGYDDGSDIGGHQKPSAPQKIVMKCMSFCELGDALTVEVAMADESLQPIFYDTAPDYEYRIYACNPQNHKDIEDEKFVANEQPKGYKQKYLSDKAAMFDINGDAKNYDLYHQETAIIDFSNYEVGESGCIAFVFLAVYAEDPLHPSYMGSEQYMYYYVGEKGTSISNLSIEDAIEYYQAVTMS